MWGLLGDFRVSRAAVPGQCEAILCSNPWIPVCPELCDRGPVSFPIQEQRSPGLILLHPAGLDLLHHGAGQNTPKDMNFQVPSSPAHAGIC